MERMESERMENMENMENAETMDAPQTEQAQPQTERVMRREQSAGVESISQTVRAIDAIEHKLMDSRRVPLTRNSVMVDLNEMADLIGQLRMVLPKSVVQAQNVLEKSQQIISAANEQADKTADEADRSSRTRSRARRTHTTRPRARRRRTMRRP